MRILVTGGAGFIGCNAADRFLERGMEVVVLDDLSRQGSARNLAWLRSKHPDLRFVQLDVRDAEAMLACVQDLAPLDGIVHLASQVAVTTSVMNPRADFEINALGTMNVLEAVRLACPEAVVLYASTNKVYGNLEQLSVTLRDRRYVLADRPFGVSEDEPLDFHSPYGCSKGAADQYVRDYARIYGLRTVVLRQSCIYGSHQFGVEDQGWLAWFTFAALAGLPITIYGDGHQTRDVLFVDDLIDAYALALTTPAAWGQILNLGGGPENTLAIWTDLGPMLEALLRRRLNVEYGSWRPGDQRCFVADVRKAGQVLGWRPATSPQQGVARLYHWASQEAEHLAGLRPLEYAVS